MTNRTERLATILRHWAFAVEHGDSVDAQIEMLIRTAKKCEAPRTWASDDLKDLLNVLRDAQQEAV